MPIFLEPPTYRPGGPDGRGWNRLSLNAHMSAPAPQCALLPRTHAALRDCQDTRRCAWGPYDPCVMGESRCGQQCPVYREFEAGRERIPVNAPRVAVRVTEHLAAPDALMNALPYSRLWVTDRPDAGDFRERGEEWTFAQLARLRGWVVGRAFRDEHGAGFWLDRGSHSPAQHAEVLTRERATSARHAVMVPGGRAALLTCYGRPCAHGPELLNVITHHAPARGDDGPLADGGADATPLPVPVGHLLNISRRRRGADVEFRHESAPDAHMRLELGGSGWTPQRIAGAASALVTHHTCALRK